MTGEINKDFYCSANCYDNGDCIFARLVQGAEKRCVTLRQLDCKNYHRKHPTPEQFKQEYGREYPDDGAVYISAIFEPYWTTELYRKAQKYRDADKIVCACTPWGCPPSDRRPK